MEAIQYVELSKLSLRPQVRDSTDDETIAGLAASIQSVGLQQPLRVRREEERLIVVDGERRLRAVRVLGWRTVQVIVEDRDLSAADVTIRQLVANCQRKGLSSIGIARALRELMAESGMSAKEAAADCGFSEASVSKLLKVLETPEAVQAKVASGELPLSTAYEIAKNCDSPRQVELANAAIAEKLTRFEVQQRVKGKGRNQGRKATRRPSPPAAVADLGGGRSITARGPDLTCISTLIEWLMETVEGLKAAMAVGCELSALREYFKERKRIRPA